MAKPRWRDDLRAVLVMTRIAIVQAGSALYDTSSSLEKLEKLTREAAANGAKLVLFPEAFLGGYPKLNDFGIVLGTRSAEGREEFRRYFNSAIEEGGSECVQLENLSRELQICLVVGVVERAKSTLYCSVFFFSHEQGFLGKHRKLMPTALERCIWGQGDGSTMSVFNTDVGRIGAAICWENYMPLYRTHLYSKEVQIYLAPTVDDRDVWLSTMRTIALEGRCYVLSACQFLRSAAYPEDHPLRKKFGDDEILIRGGSCAVDPMGRILVEPEFGVETIRYAEIDLDEIPRGKFDLDVVGHYTRPDIFQLSVNESPQLSVCTKNDRKSTDFIQD
ncbi:unnamed protein product [Caenorhabditis auriculariae]|uniref:CN hydrolase domain-containing protein n=1 Tax=Caenorhabditis auriculariae TaxID=2777116 RepID=A0A8S1GXE2_9PELO|nr:unnamed protein product [Caenorhabditis auriculariae]